MFVNEYFARHPEMMLGRMGIESGQYADAPALMGTLRPDGLEQATSCLPANVYKSRESQCPLMRPDSEQVPAAGTVKEGGLGERDGQIVACRRGVLEPLAVPASVAARIRGMLRVRDAVRDVFRTQLADSAEQTIAEARRHLNHTYDSFVSRFGPLSAKENVKALAGDPDQPLLLSLEDFDPETKRAAKTAVFEGALWSAIVRLSGSRPHPRHFSYRSMRPAKSTGREWSRSPAGDLLNYRKSLDLLHIAIRKAVNGRRRIAISAAMCA